MARPITLRVLTQEGLAFEEQTSSIIAPGEVGYLGILANHAPLVTTLKPGTLTWRRPAGSQAVSWVGAGLLEIAKNRCTILTSALSEQPPASASSG